MNVTYIDEWYVNNFGWKHNPFSFEIIPDVFVGYTKEIGDAINAIKGGEKFILLSGPTGSGKTTFLKFLIKNINERCIYLSKPPRDVEEIAKILKDKFSNFFTRLISRDLDNIYDVCNWVSKKNKGKRLLLIIDEVHEADTHMLEWLRTITDQIEGMCTILSGLPVLENILKEKLETMIKRINLTIRLSNLTYPETREMIKRRIEFVGGDDVKPFTSDAIELIYNKTNGFPRDVVRVCNEMLYKAFKSNLTTIDSSIISEEISKHVPPNITETLPDKQRTILEILNKNTELTPSEIAHYLNKEAYKSEDNAIRSINNILRRMLAEGLVERKKMGKSYKYFLPEKIKTILIER